MAWHNGGMPGDPLAPVSAGDPLPNRAETFNQVFDAARDFRSKKRRGQNAAPTNPDRVSPAHVITVVNSTGGTLPLFSVVELTDSLESLTDDSLTVSSRPAIEGIVPTATTAPFAILLDGVADGGLVRAVVGGCAVVDVDITDASHEYATPKVSTTANLTSAASGPVRILDRESGSSGIKRAVVLVSQPQSAGSGGGGVDFQNTVAADVGTQTIDEAQNADGIYYEAGTGKNKARLYAATTTQNGTVTTSFQKWTGEKQLTPGGTSGGGFIVDNVSGGITTSYVSSAHEGMPSTVYPTVVNASGLSTGERYGFLHDSGVGSGVKYATAYAYSIFSQVSSTIVYVQNPGGGNTAGYAQFTAEAVDSLNAYSGVFQVPERAIGNPRQFNKAFCSILNSRPLVEITEITTDFRMTIYSGIPVIEANCSNSAGGIGGISFQQGGGATSFIYPNFGHLVLAKDRDTYTAPANNGTVATASIGDGYAYGVVRYDSTATADKGYLGIDRDFAAGEYPVVRGGIIIGYTT